MTPADLAAARKMRERREGLRTEWKSLRLDRRRLAVLRMAGVPDREKEEDWRARRLGFGARLARWRARRDRMGADLDRRYRRAAGRLRGRPQGEGAVFAAILFWDIYGGEKSFLPEPEWVREARNAVDDDATIDIDAIEVGVALVRCGWSPEKAAVRMLGWNPDWEVRAEEVRAELADKTTDKMEKRRVIRAAAAEFARGLAAKIARRAGLEGRD